MRLNIKCQYMVPVVKSSKIPIASLTFCSTKHFSILLAARNENSLQIRTLQIILSYNYHLDQTG